MKTHPASLPRPILLLILFGFALLLVFGMVLTAHNAQVWSVAIACLVPFAVGILLRGRDPRKEWEQQAAFEEAERKRAEDRASAVFDSFIDASPVSIEIYDVKGRLIKSNKSAERLLGKVPPPGLSLLDDRGLKRAGLLTPQLKRVMAGTRVETPPVWYDPTEIGLPGIPGRKVCFRATVFPLFSAEGEVSHVAVMHEDITELKQNEKELQKAKSQPPPAGTPEVPVSGDAREIEFRRRKIEQALRESEDRHRSFVQGARGYVVLRFSEDGHILAASPSIQTIWGLSAETVLTDPSAFFARIHPDDIERVRQTEAQIRKDGRYPDEYRFRVINKDSSQTHWVESRGSISSTAGKKMLDCIALDITHLLNTEQTLKRKQADIETLLTSAADGIVTLDRNLVITHWSEGAAEETRIPAREAVGKPVLEVYPEFARAGFLPVLRKTLAEGKVLRHEGLYDDGRERLAGWFSITSYRFDSGLLLIIQNITPHKKTEQAWQDADGKLRTILDAPGLAVSIKDRELRYTQANTAALRMMGLKEKDGIVGKTDQDVLKPTVAGLLNSHDLRVVEENAAVEVELALPDMVSPRAAWYRILKCPLHDSAGRTTGILDIACDITRRVHAQQELARRREYFEKLLKRQASALKRAEKELTRWEKRK